VKLFCLNFDRSAPCGPLKFKRREFLLTQNGLKINIEVDLSTLINIVQLVGSLSTSVKLDRFQDFP